MVAQQLRRSERRKTSGYESLRVGPRASNIRLQAVLCLLVGFVLSPNTSRFAHGQYKTGTALFEDKMAEAEVELTKTLQGGEYVEDIFYPDRQYLEVDTYVYAFPDSSDYTIGIIVDPCKENSFDCCHRVYGSPEYPFLKEVDDSSYRVVDKYVHADDTEILANTIIIDKDGNTVEDANSRFADDDIVIDDNCTTNGVPEDSCVGFRQKMQRSTNVARCTDHNQTASNPVLRAQVDAYASCQDLNGETLDLCVAVAYSQTAISVKCGGDYAEDNHCGTFLELHMGFDNSYVEREEVLSEVRLQTENVSGYTTTTMSTTWMGDSSKVMCAFEHASLLVGTMVLISEDAPVCCCPRVFSQKDLLGSFVCPMYDSLDGPFATSRTTIAEKLVYEEDLDNYPFCPALDENEDLVMMSEYSNVWDRYYTREAETVVWDNSTSSYTSDDLSDGYGATCEYFPQCVTANTGSCNGDDREYTFAGRVGKITLVPDDLEEEQYAVTFNDGRTSYLFNQEHLQIEQDNNYEIWWVQRTLYNFRVQARKALTVTNPTCTFDSTNEQYYPYAELDDDGNVID